MKRWHYRCLGGMAGIVVGGILVLGLTSCDSGPIGDAAEGMRDRAGFDQARQRLVEQNAKIHQRADQLNVTHDATNSVTCWSRYDYGQTLSCLPDWMLTPPARKPVKPHRCETAAQSEPCVDASGDMWPGNEARRP